MDVIDVDHASHGVAPRMLDRLALATGSDDGPLSSRRLEGDAPVARTEDDGARVDAGAHQDAVAPPADIDGPLDPPIGLACRVTIADGCPAVVVDHPRHPLTGRCRRRKREGGDDRQDQAHEPHRVLL